MGLIYFDNAATSWPKPEEIFIAMNRFGRIGGGSPGRSGHRLSIEAGRTIIDAREELGDFFGCPDPLRVVLTKNATEALNIAIMGFLKPGDHAVTSSMEHNSVMRPLRCMERRGVEVTVVPCAPTGELDPGDISRAIKKNTRAVYLTHASNVTGTIMPVHEVGRIAAERDVVFCVDAAQTAGVIPIDVRDMRIGLLAFTGHKSLFGPQGTGGLVIAGGLEEAINPLLMGGTGSRSEWEEHPAFLPDRFEAGTPNGIGIAGLLAGLRYVRHQGIVTIRKKEAGLTALLIDGLRAIPGVRLYGCLDPERQTAVVSFTMAGTSPSEIAFALDEDFELLSRSGLQCAPAAHRTIGTFPEGTVRLSMGYFNTADEVRTAIDAVECLAGGKRVTVVKNMNHGGGKKP